MALKSLRETQPDFGVASGPVDVHLYDDGSVQDAVATVTKLSKEMALASQLFTSESVILMVTNFSQINGRKG